MMRRSTPSKFCIAPPNLLTLDSREHPGGGGTEQMALMVVVFGREIK
jgi:hypothetical protein